MASQNSTTFGASIVPIENRHQETHQASIFDSPAITPAASHENLKPSTRQATSPLYEPLSKLTPSHTRQSSRPSHDTNEKDLEAGGDNPFTSKVSVECSKECAMWPSMKTLEEKRKAEKRRKRDSKFCAGCGPVRDFWARFNSRQKLIIKIVMALLLVGAMIGIGVGISIAVNGTVYVSDDKSSQIPDPQSR